jgi:hypothetical protein
MNKIFSFNKKNYTNSFTKNTNITKIIKLNLFNNSNFITNNNHKNKNHNNLLSSIPSKKLFSITIDYSDMEKKLEKYYETINKENIEKLKTLLSEKEKKEADLVFNHLIKLSQDEKDYFKAKLDSEYRKLNKDIYEPDYTLSNLHEYNPIEIDGKTFGFTQNVSQKISSFYGQAASSSNVAVGNL